MQFSLPFIDIIIFAVIAVFLIYRLKNILGEKTGYDPAEDESKEHNKIKESSNVLDFSKKQKTKNASGLGNKLDEIKLLDKQFSVDEFISGAKIFFEMVVKGFVKGDLNNIKNYVKPTLLNNFQSAIDDREKDGETLIIDIKKIDNVTIKDILINKNNVSIKVLFESDQTKVLKDQKNTVIDGNLRKVIKVKDIWMFERNFTLKNKNWTLVETSTE